MTQDPDTAVVLCDSVKGLALTLDPSHYICGPHKGGGYEQVMKHVAHVRLRDTTKDRLQVRVGQGEVEYGKLVTQLSKFSYHRALCVDITPLPDVRSKCRAAEDASAVGKPLVGNALRTAESELSAQFTQFNIRRSRYDFLARFSRS